MFLIAHVMVCRFGWYLEPKGSQGHALTFFSGLFAEFISRIFTLRCSAYFGFVLSTAKSLLDTREQVPGTRSQSKYETLPH